MIRAFLNICIACVLFIFVVIPFCLGLIAAVGGDDTHSTKSGNIEVFYDSTVSAADANATAVALGQPAILGNAGIDLEYGLSKKNDTYILETYLNASAKNDETGVRALQELLSAVLTHDALNGSPVSVDVIVDGEPWLTVPASRVGSPIRRDRYTIFYTATTSAEEAEAVERAFVESGAIDPKDCTLGLLLFVDKQNELLKVGLKGNRPFLANMDEEELRKTGKSYARTISINAWGGGEVEYSYTHPNGQPLEGLTFSWHAVKGKADRVVADNITLFYEKSVGDELAQAVAEKMASISSIESMIRISREGDAIQIDLLGSDKVRQRNKESEELVSFVGKQLATVLPENTWLTFGVADDDMNRLWSLPIDSNPDQTLGFDYGRIDFGESLTKDHAEKLANYIRESGFDPAGVMWEFKYDLRDGYHWIQLVVDPQGVDEDSVNYLEPIISRILTNFGDDPAIFELIDSEENLVGDNRWRYSFEEKAESKEIPTSQRDIAAEVEAAFQ